MQYPSWTRIKPSKTTRTAAQSSWRTHQIELLVSKIAYSGVMLDNRAALVELFEEQAPYAHSLLDDFPLTRKETTAACDKVEVLARANHERNRA